MAKKNTAKTADKPAPTAAEIRADNWTRDDEGYGVAAGIAHNSALMEISQEQIDAALALLTKNGDQAVVVKMSEQVTADTFDAFKEVETCDDWTPNAPAGEGWELVFVLHNGKEGAEADALAMFARSAADVEPAAEADAAMFLVGNLMKAAKRRFTELAVPWRELKEHEQSRVLGYLAEDVRVAVGKAIKAIASNQRLTFRAEVESVQFKGASDIKAVLKLMGGPESHALADADGGFVTVVIENVDELLEILPGDTKGDADQKPLFDASTEGTALDTKPEKDAVPA